jgi:type I restriction enzyme S subunit
MNGLKPYDKYKSSGIAWLGDIPEHWEISKAKHILFQKKKTLNPNLNCGSISFGNIVFKDNERVPVETKATYQELLIGEFLINPLNLNFDLKSLRTGLSTIDVVVSTGYIVLQNNPKFNKRYLKWLLHQFDVSFMKTLGDGVRQTLSYNDFKNTNFPYISIPEQTAIARFLDYKLAKINRFIQKKKQLIKLLNEQKAAIINQAVTKGLDANVKMKPSGIEWLGEIPEHWEKHKLKYLISKPIAGAWGTEPQNDDNDIVCVRVADFKEYEIKTENLTIRNIEAKPEQILKPGDLLLEKSGGGEKTPVGRVVLFNQSFKAVTSNFVSKFSPKTNLVTSEYLLFIFKLINSVKWNFRSLKQTTGIQNIDTYQYMDNWVFIPKIEEQKTIVNHIKIEFKVLDETISKIEKELALTEEYKTALIAEAVTGKIDVRGYVVPELMEEGIYEEIEEELGMVAEDGEEYEIREME